VEQGYYCFRINRTLDIGDPESVQASVSDLRNQLLIAGISQRTAGIVLTFGVHENVGSGGRIAERFNEVALPQIAVFGTAAFRAFGDGGAKTGEWMTSTGKSVSETIKGGVRIDIYLLATVDDEPHPRDEKGDRRCG
jgi:hypothetical protein